MISPRFLRGSLLRSVCVRVLSGLTDVKPSCFIPPPTGQRSFIACEFTHLHLHVV